jgi:hypothetical protein
LVFSFGLILSSILRWTMACASSIHNNLNCLWLNFDILSNSSPSCIDIHLSVQVFQSCELFEISTWFCSLPSTSFNFLRTSLYELCVLFVYSLPVCSYILSPPDSDHFHNLLPWTIGH